MIDLTPTLRAAMLELERQAEENRPDTPYLDLDEPVSALIDGKVDLIKLVDAIVAAAPDAPLPWRTGQPPEDGTKIAGLVSMRFLAYKPNSEQRRRGIKGRWQSAKGDYGGWENCERPERWLPHPTPEELARG